MGICQICGEKKFDNDMLIGIWNFLKTLDFVLYIGSEYVYLHCKEVFNIYDTY
jgi:hypothetical protein